MVDFIFFGIGIIGLVVVVFVNIIDNYVYIEYFLVEDVCEIVDKMGIK